MSLGTINSQKIKFELTLPAFRHFDLQIFLSLLKTEKPHL